MVIPIKIQCGCGQKYAFDVDPAYGQMPQTVQCPACGADGTAAANQIIAQHLAAQAPTPTLRPAGLASRTSHTPVSQPQPSVSAPAPRKRSNVLIPGIIIGVLVVAATGGGVWFWMKHRQEAPVVAAVPDDGLPHTLAELNAWYVEPPEGQNAAKFYQPAFDALQISMADRNSTVLPLVGKSQLPSAESPVPGNVKSAVNGFVKRNQSAWDSLQKAAKFEQCRYPLDFNQGSKLLLPHLTKIKLAAQLSVLFALQQADSGNSEQAAEGVLTALAVARSLEQEPLLIDQLIRVVSVAIAVEGLEQTVNRISLSPSSLESLRRSFQQSEAFDTEGTGFMRALVGERANGLALFDMPPEKLLEDFSKSGTKPEDAAKFSAHIKDVKTMKVERQFYLETFQEVLTAHKQAFPDRLKAGVNVPKRVEEATQKEFFVVSLFMPALGAGFSKEAGGLAYERLALTAIALERFRATHENKYPSSLNELTPEFLASVPQDPFDGQPLRYSKNGDGYELHSIGAEPAKPVSFKVVKPPKAIPD